MSLSSTKYVLMISGGIDSMTMLDLIAGDINGFRSKNFLGANYPDDFVVAHFNHGIRGQESLDDALFVREQSEKYGLRVIIEDGNLPSNSSEEIARNARRQFMRQIRRRFLGQNIAEVKFVVAHIENDLLETAIMFLLRGTGWRGLAPMISDNDIIRPLISWTKFSVTNYALENDVSWVVDKTNFSFGYFRNRVRAIIDTFSDINKQALLELIKNQQQLMLDINICVDKYLLSISHSKNTWPRYDFIMLPVDVAIEVLKEITRGRLTHPQLLDLLIFIKIGKPGKKKHWSDLFVELDKSKVYIAN